MKNVFRRSICLFVGSLLFLGCQSQGTHPSAVALAATPNPTVGGGTLSEPAVGPPAAFSLGGPGFVLVKNWDFGRTGTIRNIQDMNTHFQYHDQFNTIGNGTHYGAVTVSPDRENALPKQPLEDPQHPVREFQADSLKTFLVPLTDSKTVKPDQRVMGCGSFQAKWTLPHAGKLLNQDILFETRVRYVTPPYFWFAIWTAGNQWNKGAEADVVESFGYDNGNNNTNFDGRFWHSDVVGGTNTVAYKEWNQAMRQVGVLTDQKPTFDATQYHVWSWLYRTDDTYTVYLDGIDVQHGVLHWTLGGKDGGTPLNMSFLFDGTWGHAQIPSVNKPLPVTDFLGKFYEWDYSRVYLRTPSSTTPTTQDNNKH